MISRVKRRKMELYMERITISRMTHSDKYDSRLFGIRKKENVSDILASSYYTPGIIDSKIPF